MYTTIGNVLVFPAHGSAAPAPAPHWMVLFLVVPALWILIGGLVVAFDRLLRRFGV